MNRPGWVLAAVLLGCAHPQRATSSRSPAAESADAGSSTTTSAAVASQPTRSPCALPKLVEASSEELIAGRGTSLEAYQLEGGAWLPNAPILVNQDFDFAMAMAMGPVGAGLAAGKRKDSNQRKVAELSGVMLGADLAARLDALRAEGVHAYFVLWGAENATLRSVLERNAGCEPKTDPLVLESAPRELSVWGEPGILDAEARALLERSGAALSAASSASGPK